ncbi:autotransporter outer membrane beta-barrel domain-containing protein, partial [Pseudomonas frederiksbergensis]|nr:autotransporter outer membrane beta-barrel domain-containing protein [Pseudomonas frederiksbergensis]
PLHNIDNFTVHHNQLLAIVTNNFNEKFQQIITNQGGSANSQKALGSLTADGMIGKLANNDPFKQALLNADEAQVAKLASELTPETNGGATQAATTSQNLVSNVTGSRTS